MPPRRRNTAPLTLGIAGSGQLKPAALTALLDDLASGNKIEVIYIPVTDADYTDEVAAVVKWATQNNIDYCSLSDEAAQKNRTLKKVIAGAQDDYDGGENAGKAVIELLKGEEDEPVEDGRLLLFFDGDNDADVELFEEANALEVAAFDLCNGLERMVFEDEAEEPAAEEAAAEEPQEEEQPRRRGRRARADDGDADDGPAVLADAPAPAEDRAALESMTMVELKKRLKSMDEKRFTTDSLRGKKKDELIALIVGEGEGASADNEQLSGDEAQATIIPLAQEGEEPVEEPAPEVDDREAVFARLRANRERAEQMAVHLTRSLRAIAEEGDADEAAERAAAALASSLMLFAEFVITEVRKPKSPGRPRKDGTEAQPREAQRESTGDEATPPRRRRRSA